MLAQLFDSQHVVHVNFQWAAHEIRQRGRQSQVVVTAREKEEKAIVDEQLIRSNGNI